MNVSKREPKFEYIPAPNKNKNYQFPVQEPIVIIKKLQEWEVGNPFKKIERKIKGNLNKINDVN